VAKKQFWVNMTQTREFVIEVETETPAQAADFVTNNFYECRVITDGAGEPKVDKIRRLLADGNFEEIPRETWSGEIEEPGSRWLSRVKPTQ
jgi:hypothetical protein